MKDHDHIKPDLSEDVAMCVLTLDRVIGELANRHGAASVAAALIEVVGCSSCVHDDSRRGVSIRTLLGRIAASK